MGRATARAIMPSRSIWIGAMGAVDVGAGSPLPLWSFSGGVPLTPGLAGLAPSGGPLSPSSERGAMGEAVVRARGMA